jgi:hypothetical protein
MKIISNNSYMWGIEFSTFVKDGCPYTIITQSPTGHHSQLIISHTSELKEIPVERAELMSVGEVVTALRKAEMCGLDTSKIIELAKTAFEASKEPEATA